MGDRGPQAVLELLAARLRRDDITRQTELRVDLDLDSMGWIELTTEIGRLTGVWLDDDSLSRMDTVGELLDRVAVAGSRVPTGGPLQDPDGYLDADQLRRVRLRGHADALAARMLFELNRAVGRAMFRLTVRGRENLPATGALVIAPTHMSYLDGFAIAGVLPYRRLRETYFATFADQAFANRVTTAASRPAALLPIDGEAAPLASLAFGAAVLQRGRTLVWFPSGQRSTSSEVEGFRPGIGALLDHFRVPVVPTVIIGSREAMPLDRTVPRPHPITVVFDRPVRVADLEASGTGMLARERITNALHDHLVSLFGSWR